MPIMNAVSSGLAPHRMLQQPRTGREERRAVRLRHRDPARR
jgi:hypothetical protein